MIKFNFFGHIFGHHLTNPIGHWRLECIPFFKNLTLHQEIFKVRTRTETQGRGDHYKEKKIIYIQKFDPNQNITKM